MPFYFCGVNAMTFDAGTWWLVGVLLTALLGVVGGLVSQAIFKKIDENSADIKQVRENYTTRKDHKEDMETVQQRIETVRNEMRTEIKSLGDDIKEIKETCLRNEDFLRQMMRLENQMDELRKYLMGGGKNV